MTNPQRSCTALFLLSETGKRAPVFLLTKCKKKKEIVSFLSKVKAMKTKSQIPNSEKFIWLDRAREIANYYTGNVFEVYDKEQRIKGSIAAGGRYDKMIGNFIGDGEEYPTVGISFGLSAIYEIFSLHRFRKRCLW